MAAPSFSFSGAPSGLSKYAFSPKNLFPSVLTGKRCMPLFTLRDAAVRHSAKNFFLHHQRDSYKFTTQRQALKGEQSPTDDLQAEPHLSYFTSLESLRPLLSLLFSHKRVFRNVVKNRPLQVISMARQKGRVGTYKREGNISLASFGIKVKRNKSGKQMDVTKSLSKLLPYVVVATAASALLRPASFSWVSKSYYAPALGGIMLSIGVQLQVSDFALAIQRPVPVLIGFFAQYVLKPCTGLVVAKLFNVPDTFAAGLILTSCVAGAQLSSYAAFLSEGDVGLSIILTSLTTVASVALTPLLTRLLIGSVVPVNVVAMATSILQVVIGPVFLGLCLNTYCKPLVDRVRSWMPLMAMVCTSLCIGSPLALNRDHIISAQGLQLLLPVLAFHTTAFVIGYWIARASLWRQNQKVSRTISLCTGMQSSTLAMLLATQFLGASHAVPPACSVVVMALMGLTLASFWGKGNRLLDGGGNIFNGEFNFVRTHRQMTGVGADLRRNLCDGVPHGSSREN